MSIMGGLVSPFQDGLGPHPLEPEKPPACPALNPRVARGMAAETGPKLAAIWGARPPPHPLSLLAEQVLTIETKGSLGRAFVILIS